MTRRIDLRSDTVTRPTPAMYKAMAEAELGDDVLGDDPTVHKLEEAAAAKLGKEAGLFVPSGSMANNIAIKTHTKPGDEALFDWEAHSLCMEVGGPAALAGVLTRQFRSPGGVPDVDEIAAAIRPETLHSPGTRLLVLENTHNRLGGAIIPLDVHRHLFSLAKETGMMVHVDGARLFNAAVATGTPASEFAAQADSVSFCLSKGLGCPVGSLLCGTRDFVERARRVRKLFGGGMRQAGILAACGVVALETMIERLADDHSNAKRLAMGIHGLPGTCVDVEAVATNMVYLTTTGSAKPIEDKLAERGVLCIATSPKRIRLVTHKDVSAADIEEAIEVFRLTINI